MRGIVFLGHQISSKVLTIADQGRKYEQEAPPSAKDLSAPNTIIKNLEPTRLTEINAAWVEHWIINDEAHSGSGPGPSTQMIFFDLQEGLTPKA
ncbi:UNVERIFIED_CONTAM: hypothetical protein NO986_22780 [Comamonas sp. A-3]|nr:hypothetical protein [Comamonas thiooxydans]